MIPEGVCVSVCACALGATDAAKAGWFTIIVAVDWLVICRLGKRKDKMCMKHAPNRTRKASRLERLPRRNILGCVLEIVGMIAWGSSSPINGQNDDLKKVVDAVDGSFTFGDRRRRQRGRDRERKKKTAIGYITRRRWYLKSGSSYLLSSPAEYGRPRLLPIRLPQRFQ